MGASCLDRFIDEDDRGVDVEEGKWEEDGREFVEKEETTADDDKPFCVPALDPSSVFRLCLFRRCEWVDERLSPLEDDEGLFLMRVRIMSEAVGG